MVYVPLGRWTIWLVWKLETRNTLWWGHWEPRFISTVVIDHVVHTNPLILSSLKWTERLVSCSFPPIAGVWGTVRGSWHRAPFNIKVLVISIERCFAPINLFKSTSCSPVISFPQCWIDPHRLQLWEWDSFSFVILVDPNWHIIDIETAVPNNNNINNTIIDTESN